MSTRLGTLTLDLVARIGSFTGPIRDAERQTESSFANMRNHVNNFGAIAIAGAAAVGAGIFAMANEYSNAASELAVFAFISKTTTQEFQSYAAGAKTMGIEMETLSGQFKDFNEKLGEFVTLGSGGAVDFFEKIAIETEGSAEGARKLALEMQNLSGPKALQLYMDKLEEAGATQQQMSFYLESMAGDTTNLIPLLRNGGEGFKFWADAAERAGVIMDESAIQKAAELRVQVDLLTMQVEGAEKKFIQGLMPALVSVGDAMSQGSVETNLMTEAGETLGEVFKGVAATGMGVYAVVKMLSNAIAGLAFDAVNAKKSVDIASQGQGWFSNLWGTRNIKTALLAGMNLWMDNDKSGISMAAEDNKKVIEDVSVAINNLYDNTVSEAVSSMAKIQGAHAGVTRGSDEWVAKQNEVAKATKVNTKANQDFNKVLEEQKRILYEYSTSDNQQKMDLESEIQRLTKNGMSDFIPTAKARFDAEQRLIKMKFEFELAEHLMTEEKKLKFSNTIKQQEIMADAKLSKDQRAEKIKSLQEVFNQETAAYKRTQQAQLLEAKRHWVSAEDYARDYYALIREEILATSSYSPEMKQALVKEANFNQGMGENADREQVWGDYQSMMGLDKSPYQQDMDLLVEARAQMLLTEEEYFNSRAKLQLAYGSNYLSSTADVLKSLLGEESSYYHVAFAMAKGMAAAKVALNAPETYSNAYNAVVGIPYVGPYIAPVVGAGAVAFQLAQAAVIGNVQLTGMAHDGIDNIPKEGTWLLDKGERVVDSRTNGDLKDYLAKGGGGGGNVTINQSINIASDGTATTQNDSKQLGALINNAVLAVIRKEQRQGGLLSR